ncbi:MAG: sigma-70 family RNA polymerase sigma factor [bacterium]|nr:sigma-70 family RNA polymerase sigma factor [bacterium]
MPEPGSDVTRLLHAWREGDPDALERLTPLVYQELRRLAHNYMRGEREGHMLQTTALVHEAYLRLVDLELGFQDRVHFFAVSARLMRRVLVDLARERKAAKRGGEAVVLPLEEGLVATKMPGSDVLALDLALEQLASFDARKARVVELRVFGGLTIDETAEVLEVSHATVERDLKLAKAWLARSLSEAAD